jgi:O-antigen ligase
MGGSGRPDTASLILLRPLSVLSCAAALITLRWSHWDGRRGLLVFAIATLTLAVAHVIPLPPALWQALPGRERLAQIDELVQLSDIWRPLTMTPMNGWHALSSLFVPLAVLLLGVQLSPTDRKALLPLLILLVAFSGILGLLQVIGNPKGPLYLYRITNNGYAVGLFANRNHAAVLLVTLFPMLAVFASVASGDVDKQTGRLMLALAILAVTIPLILVTGSRAGVFLGAAALLTTPLLYGRPVPGRVVRRGGQSWHIKWMPLAAGVLVILLIIVTILLSRALSLDRLLASETADDLRFKFWEVGLKLAQEYFPVGSGAGSFVEVFQSAEPDELLRRSYVNRLHNDWLETIVIYGLPGLLLLGVAIIGCVRRCFAAWRRYNTGDHEQLFARMSSTIAVIVALASIVDYPLRTPIMMSVTTLAALWLFRPILLETVTPTQMETS